MAFIDMSENSKNQDDTANIQRAEADLALIRSMMQVGRKRVGVDGSHLILWGCILMCSFFSTYYAITGLIQIKSLYIWLFMWAVGIAGSMYIGSKTPSIQYENNLSLKAYDAAGVSVGFGILIYFFVALFMDKFSGTTITILSAAGFAIEFMVVGAVTGIKVLKYIAFGWWAILAIVTGVDFGDDSKGNLLLFMGTASGLLILIPGLYLQHLSKNEA